MYQKLRLIVSITLLACVGACGTTQNEKRYSPSAVFKKQGEYEKDSSFQRRKAAHEAADKFFSRLSKKDCLIRKDEPHRCYRADNTGSLEIYTNGVKAPEETWERVHNTLCIRGRCRQPGDFRKLKFRTYKQIYPE